MNVVVRPAKIEDAREIAQTHFDSVHATGAQFYSADICEEWSPSLTDKRIKGFADAIQSNVEIMFVAVGETQIMGFASIVPKSSELRSVYVGPKFGGLGIGKQLLAKLEEESRSRGLKKLVMDASLSAESFYRSQGYIEISRIEHALGSGRKMLAIRMEKVFP